MLSPGGDTRLRVGVGFFSPASIAFSGDLNFLFLVTKLPFPPPLKAIVHNIRPC